MSGGYFNYSNDSLCSDIYDIYPDYGARGFDQSPEARRRNPLEDPELSELVYDVFCLLHSYDWYRSADTCEETYRADVKRFKEKWFKGLPEDRVSREIESALDMARDDIRKTLLNEVSDPYGRHIRIKYFEPDLEPIGKIAVGDWIDLRAAEDVTLSPGEYRLIRLGVGMILPNGYEAYVLPRSSTPNKFGIMLANSMGVIDNSYSGDCDEWKFPAIAIRETRIRKGDRIAQFRIMENQPRLCFTTVSHLNAESRGGIGSTGKR